MWGRRVRRTRSGGFDVRLPAPERDLLRTLVPQLREALSEGVGEGEVDPHLRRLFPTAYPDDVERDAEYRRMVGDDLLERRQSALDTVESTIDATHLDEEQLLAWMGAVNDLRLVLGTRLDVSEETDLLPRPDDPEAPLIAVYGYLGLLLESIVEALAE